MPGDFLPFLIQIVFVAGVAVAMVVLSHLLGPRKYNQDKMGVYECGVTPKFKTPARFSVKFYLVAVLFVLFDVEAVFMYPWAVIFKRFLITNGPFIFYEMLLFIAILAVGLLYMLRRGVLDWNNPE